MTPTMTAPVSTDAPPTSPARHHVKALKSQRAVLRVQLHQAKAAIAAHRMFFHYMKHGR